MFPILKDTASAAAMLAAYFLGTVPYAKTLIRKRDVPRVLTISIDYHAMLVVAAMTWMARAMVGHAVVTGPRTPLAAATIRYGAFDP